MHCFAIVPGMLPLLQAKGNALRARTAMEIVFLILILVFSVVIHEVAHGFAAHFLGDPTARLEGRLTLNPVSHVDPLGSVVLPAILALSSSPFLFGWAKPVPYNPYNFQKMGRFGEAFVAGAGPAANLLIALVCGLAVRFSLIPDAAVGLAISIVFLNVLLAFFNLLPIPPLDGSKILPQVLPRSLARAYGSLRASLEHNILLGFGVVILAFMVLSPYFIQAVSWGTYIIIGK